MRVLLVDDELPALEEMEYLLGSYESIEIVGQISNSLEVLPAIRDLEPDVVFLDIDMPGMNGLELALEIQARQSGIMIVFVTAYSQYALEAFQAYPHDYILKPVDEERLGQTIARLGEYHQMQRLNQRQPGKIHIRCFGKLELYREDESHENLKWTTRRAKDLFAYLLTHFEKSISRQELLQVFFAGIEDKKTVNYLHVTVYKVRSLLEGFGIARGLLDIRENYSLEIAEGLCDYVDFVRFVSSYGTLDQDNVAEAERIVTLYRGDFLEEEDYLWAFEMRDWLKREYEELLLQLAMFYISNNIPGKAEKNLKQLLQVNPLSDTGHHELLELYILQKNHPKFRAHYENYKHILQEELELVPEEKYRSYYESLLRGF